jgi:hypothetical protein
MNEWQREEGESKKDEDARNLMWLDPFKGDVTDTDDRV